jgi:predicted ABC-type ATPase
MLIQKSYDANDIVCFKLVNGDEIVAKIIEANAAGFVVNRPCTVVPSKQGLGLMQSMFSADINNNVTLRPEHVMMHASVLKEIESHYIKTTTGIDVDAKKIVY